MYGKKKTSKYKNDSQSNDLHLDVQNLKPQRIH